MKSVIVVEVISWLFAILFIYTGIGKLMEFQVFKDQFELSPVLKRFPYWFAWLIPIVEFVTAVLLIYRRSRLLGLFIAFVLMVLFTIYIIIVVNDDARFLCSCGGGIELLSWKQHLLFNTALIFLLLIGMYLQKRGLKASDPTYSLLRIHAVLFCLLIGCSGCFDKSNIITGLEGKPLPSFNLLLADSITDINTENISDGKPIAFLYYTPSCAYCKAQINDIIDNIKELQNVRFYILTSASYADMKHVYDYFKMGRYSNIIAGLDYKDYFARYFTVPLVPYLAIYDNQKRLKQVFIGRTDIGKIKSIVN